MEWIIVSPNSDIFVDEGFDSSLSLRESVIDVLIADSLWYIAAPSSSLALSSFLPEALIKRSLRCFHRSSTLRETAGLSSISH